MYNTKINACAFKDLNFNFFRSITLRNAFFWELRCVVSLRHIVVIPGATGTINAKVMIMSSAPCPELIIHRIHDFASSSLFGKTKIWKMIKKSQHSKKPHPT